MNTVHRIEPEWSSVGTSLLRILVGAGNDGLFEDTLSLHNDLMGVSPRSSLVPEEFELAPCYPNPFNSTTMITYSLASAAHVRLVVYDLLGREVTTLVHEKKAAGTYEAALNAVGLASGVHFYRIQASQNTKLACLPEARRQAVGQTGNFVQTRKMLLIR